LPNFHSGYWESIDGKNNYPERFRRFEIFCELVLSLNLSIVRGTTSRARVKTLREAGAAKIHMRVSCPPLVCPCFFGIDFPTQKELIAAKHSIDWIRDFIGVDTLEYLSLQGMLDAMPLNRQEFCTACFSAEYPIKPAKKVSKYALEKA
jgi:amidophosphoribosyltransferase